MGGPKNWLNKKRPEKMFFIFRGLCTVWREIINANAIMAAHLLSAYTQSIPSKAFYSFQSFVFSPPMGFETLTELGFAHPAIDTT